MTSSYINVRITTNLGHIIDIIPFIEDVEIIVEDLLLSMQSENIISINATGFNRGFITFYYPETTVIFEAAVVSSVFCEISGACQCIDIRYYFHRLTDCGTVI